MSKREHDEPPMFMLLWPVLFCARELTKLARGGLVPDGVRALATVSAAKTVLDAAMAQRLGKTDAAHLRRIVARLAPKPG